VLEQTLQDFSGALCFITHDRHLINAVANKVIEVNAGQLAVFPGNYADYLYKKELERQAETQNGNNSSAEDAESKDKAARRSKEQKRLEAEARNRFYRERWKFGNGSRPSKRTWIGTRKRWNSSPVSWPTRKSTGGGTTS